MPAPTFDSVNKAATQKSPTVSHYIKAHDLLVRHTIIDRANGAKTAAKLMGVSVSTLIDYATKGVDLYARAFKSSMNVS